MRAMNSVPYIVINLLALVVGQFLVTRGHWSGFLVWCAANIYSAATCVATGIPETSCLFAAYFLVNACSLKAWIAKARRPASHALGAQA
jgi:hypothetical protein